MIQQPVEIRLLVPNTDRVVIGKALRLLAMEFVTNFEWRENWVNRMFEVMSHGYDDVVAGTSDRGGAVFVGLQGDDILSVFTLKFYQRELIANQQYFVVDNTRQRIAVSSFGDIANAMCGQDDGRVVSEYDLSFVKPAFRGLNLHQRASVSGYNYVLEKHQGKGVSFALVRSSIAGQGSQLGRQLRDHIVNTVGPIFFSSYRSQTFDQHNSIAMSDAISVIKDADAFTIHKLSGAAAHIAKKYGGNAVGYLVSNFSTLFMTCHRP